MASYSFTIIFSSTHYWVHVLIFINVSVMDDIMEIPLKNPIVGNIDDIMKDLDDNY